MCHIHIHVCNTVTQYPVIQKIEFTTPFGILLRLFWHLLQGFTWISLKNHIHWSVAIIGQPGTLTNLERTHSGLSTTTLILMVQGKLNVNNTHSKSDLV